MELMVEASPRRIYANAHTYHINSISVNSDAETYLSADDLRINLWHLDITDQSFNIVDIKPANMEELTEVITAAEFHPTDCNYFVYSSSKGLIRLCDMRMAALCDRHAKRNISSLLTSYCNLFSNIWSGHIDQHDSLQTRTEAGLADRSLAGVLVKFYAFALCVTKGLVSLKRQSRCLHLRCLLFSSSKGFFVANIALEWLTLLSFFHNQNFTPNRMLYCCSVRGG